MYTQVVNKLDGEQKGEANLEDLQVEDAAEDNVKGGREGITNTTSSQLEKRLTANSC